jgi:hypothetical protein
MQTTLIDSADLFRLVHFFDVLAAIVFAVSGMVVAGLPGISDAGALEYRQAGLGVDGCEATVGEN